MKFFFICIIAYYTIYAFDESTQLQTLHPLQEQHNTQKTLHSMQSDIKTYLYQTPLSSYAYFNKHSASLQSKSLITWIHGNIYTQTLAAEKKPYNHATLNESQYAHLGDYRYDLFTLLSDLLLKMQADSDFSGAKEKAIMGALIDSYFNKLDNQKLQCHSLDDALVERKNNNVLLQYTKIIKGKRRLKVGREGLSPVDYEIQKILEKKLASYFKTLELLDIKDLAIDYYGNYMLLSEGKSPAPQDDIIFTLSAHIVPISYQLNDTMKKSFYHKSRTKKAMVVSSFNQSKTRTVSIKKQDFFLSRLYPDLKLEPVSEQTKAYKDYAAALGFMLASFHSNPKIKSCATFSQKVHKNVKKRMVKTELISMVYAYNETLEQKWEDFTDKEVVSLR